MRCSIEQQKEEMVGKVALCGRNAQESDGCGDKEGLESEQVGLTTLVESPDVITLINWS